MGFSSDLLVWLSVILSVALILLFNWRQPVTGSRKQPPGPRPWPIFGNMFDLGTLPHQTLSKLKFEYGPVLYLKLGFTNTVVVQSATAAAELFKNHDASFCDRKCLDVYTSHNYNQASMVLGHYGAIWRILRRLCSMELMANKRINETTFVRTKCVDQMIRHLEDEIESAESLGESGCEMSLSHFLFTMSFNVVGNLTLSRDLLDSQCKEGPQFFAAMKKIMELAGKPNVADFFPFLKWLDPQGIKRNMIRDLGQTMEIVAGFVKERIKEQKLRKEKTRDFLDVLLEYESDGKEGPEKFSFEQVIIIILDMFLAGTETTSSTIEWAMAELLRNPYVMRNVKQELDQIIGRNRKVEENDIDNLPYLQAVVKETLRLHPPAPLLVPRNALRHSTYMGYHIPKDAQIFVNVWAIGRDPESWKDPLSFKPERFLGSNIDYRGQNFELIPFGSGRRICVGLSLAHRLIHLALASLLHCFDWEPEKNTGPETIDMNETSGLTARKLVPLKVVPKKRTNLMSVKDNDIS